MKGQDPKSSSQMWQKLILIGEKEGSMKLSDLAEELELSEEETLVFLRHLFPTGEGAEVYQDGATCMVDLNADCLQYMLPLNPGEWVRLHQMLSELPPAVLMNSPELLSLTKKVTETGPMKVIMDLFSKLEKAQNHFTIDQLMLIDVLDRGCDQRNLLQLKTIKGKWLQVYPWRTLHLEGSLSLIAEDGNDHCLMVLPVQEIVEATPVTGTSASVVSLFEVEEFIGAVRSMSERETRLILKIYSPGTVNLFPEHHFLGKPCMITNPAGDMIWAAYVEPCADLFEWLLELGDNVEILDPTKFKDEYLSYCEEKLRKIA
jgi:hypothetical protein